MSIIATLHSDLYLYQTCYRVINDVTTFEYVVIRSLKSICLFVCIVWALTFETLDHSQVLISRSSNQSQGHRNKKHFAAKFYIVSYSRVLCL